jgi:RND family efflux transporter MFP subunit
LQGQGKRKINIIPWNEQKRWRGVLMPAAVFMFLCLLLPGWGTGCSSSPGAGEKEAVTVELTSLEQREMHETIKVSGQASAHRQVSVALELPGRVEEVMVKLGDAVEAGDLLVKLESRDQQVQLLQAQAGLAGAQAQYAEAQAGAGAQDLAQGRAALRQAESAYAVTKSNRERMEILQREGIISLQELEMAISQYETAAAGLQSAGATLQKMEEGASSYTLQALQAQVKQAEAAFSAAQRQYEKMFISAPVSGKVAAVLLHVGELAAAGSPAVMLVDDDPIYIDIYVDEAQVGYLAPGDPVLVEVPAATAGLPAGAAGNGGHAFRGTIREASPAALAGSRSFQLRVELPNEAGLIKHGMFARVFLQTRYWENAVVVPASAVQQRDGRDYIFFYHEGYARAVEVKTGEQVEEMVQVEGDLPPLPVIARAPRSLNDGDAVKLADN